MKTVIFDFDGTLTKKSNEIWRNIWIRLDAADIDDCLYTKYNNGELDYKSWCAQIEKEFINRHFNTIILDELINKIELMDNLKEALIELKNNGYDLRILSGGINYVIYSLLKENANLFSDIMCTKFVFNEEGMLTKIIDMDSDEEGKGRYITNFIKETNSNPQDIIFVGNGHNDRFVSSSGCTTICVNPNGTDHLDKNIWHYYIENTNSLKDIVTLIENIHE